MTKLNPWIQFLILVTLFLTITFLLHTFFLSINGHPKDGDQIIIAYIINGVMAFLIFGALFRYRLTLKNYIGFLFMGGSFLKFIIFFILFYPPYKADGEMSRLEFLAFFVPYAICLILETIFTAKMLQMLDEKSH